MITDPITFEEALKLARAKQPLPTNLSSADLMRLAGEVKRRAVFSATVDDARVLTKVQEQLELIAGGGVDGHGRIGSIPEARAQLLELLRSTGYQPKDGEAGTIKDLLSDGRRQLIMETNVLDTLNFGRWKASQNKVTLAVNPAEELVRIRDSKVPRNWEERWKDARATVDPSGSTDVDETGRMVALKNDPIWDALGEGAGGYDDVLGNPWAPFAFNSGMGTISVSRKDAIELGILDPDDEVEPDQDHDLNDKLEAGIDGISEIFHGALEKGGLFRIIDGILTLAGANDRVQLERVLLAINDQEAESHRQAAAARTNLTSILELLS